MNTNTTIATEKKEITIEVAATETYIEEYLNKFAKEIHDGMIIDDHNDKPCKIDGIVLLGNGYVCPTFHNSSRYWSLNNLYFDKDGKIHMAIASVSGVMMRYRSLDESVAKYNDKLLSNKVLIDIFCKDLIIGWYEF